MANREWTVGDRVFVYDSYAGKFEQESKIVKIHKNGNFLVEFENYLGEKYTQQFSAKYSDGYHAHATGEGWRKRQVRFVTPELEQQEANYRGLKERKQVQSDLIAEFKSKGTLTADQLQRIKSIINEETLNGQA